MFFPAIMMQGSFFLLLILNKATNPNTTIDASYQVGHDVRKPEQTHSPERTLVNDALSNEFTLPPLIVTQRPPARNEKSSLEATLIRLKGGTEAWRIDTGKINSDIFVCYRNFSVPRILGCNGVLEQVLIISIHFLPS